MSARLLDPGFDLTLRPMRYPQFYEMYRDAIRNTWTVEEVDFSLDTNDLKNKLGPAERHLVERLVAFFATGDSIVSNNLVLNLYQHINAPEARMFLSRQLYEEALHVQFYLTLLDTYLPDPAARARAFAAVENIPSIRKKAEFCFRWMDSVQELRRLDTQAQRRRFLLNLVCFAACIEGLFFFGAFAYVYYLRSRGLLHGLAGGTTAGSSAGTCSCTSPSATSWDGRPSSSTAPRTRPARSTAPSRPGPSASGPCSAALAQRDCSRSAKVNHCGST